MKIWAVIAILMTICVWAGFFGIVAALLVLLVAFTSTYGALMLLTRCPKCSNQVLGNWRLAAAICHLRFSH